MRRSGPARPGRHHRAGLLRRSARLLLVALTALVVGGLPPLLQTDAAHAVTSLRCDQATVYGLDGNRSLQAIDVVSGTATPVTALASNTNALGISTGGRHAYAFSSGGGANVLEDYDAATGTTSTVPGVDSGVAAIRGAVNPATGLFYYAVNTPASGSSTTTAIGAYDPATGTRYQQVASVRVPTSGSGGDMAFSRAGTLYFLTGNLLYRVDDPVPAASGSTVLDATLLTTISGISSSPGLAFAANGYLYASSGTTLKQIDPTSGTVTGTVTMSGGYSPSDLGACNDPDTLAASVAVDERVRPTDQWTVALGGGSTWSGASSSATTTGTATGVQADVAGPVLAVGGRTYTATQTMASGSPGDYSITWSCADADGVLGSGTGGSASVVPRTGTTERGSDVDCRFTNTARTAQITWSVSLGVPRASAADQLRLAVHRDTAGGTTIASTTTTGSGSAVGAGSTGATTTTARRDLVLTAAAAPGSATAFGSYDALVTCTDPTGTATGLPDHAAFPGSLALQPPAGADVRCTLTASPRAAAVRAGIALTGPRFAAGDQFTVSAADAGGTPLGSGAGTTTGAGASVGTGTGTTGAFSVPGGADVAIAATATAHASRYRTALTCTDAQGTTANPPSHDPFTGGAVVRPGAGADLSCAVEVSASPADLTIGIAAPGALAVGTAADYAVTIGNDGGTAAVPTVAVRLPAGLAFAGSGGAGWTCTAAGTVAAGQTVGCTGPSVAAGGTTAATLHVVPDVAAAGTDAVVRATVDRAGGTSPAAPAGCTSTGPGCAVAATRTVGSGVHLGIAVSGPAALVPNVPAQYGLRVTNTGTGPAASATVLDVLPEGVRLDGAAGAACTASGRDVTCTLPGPVAAGGAADVVLHVTPLTVTAGSTLVDRASVDPTGGTTPPPTTPACTAPTCAATSATGQAPGLTLGVALVGPGGRLAAGDVVRWAYTATNTGTAAVEALALTDAEAVCATTTLAPGARTTCTTPASAVTQADVDAGRLVRTATASARTAGCLLGCGVDANEARAVALTALPALGVRIGAPDTLTVGVPAAYAVTVTGYGRTAVPTVAVRLAPGVVHAGSGTGWDCSATGTATAGQLVTCTGPAVAPGAERVLALRVAPTASAADERAAASASVDPSGGSSPAEPVGCTSAAHGTECDRTPSVAVLNGVALAVAVAGPAVLVPHVPADYVVTVTNTGTGTADRASVLTVLPAGVAFQRAEGAGCTVDGRRLTCTVPGPIGPGGRALALLHVLPELVEEGAPVALATSVDPDGGADPAAPAPAACAGTCDTTTAVATQPTLTLAVRVRGDAQALRVGDPVRYVYTVRNTGPVAVRDLVLSDGTTCRTRTLAPGSSTTCVAAPRRVTQADVDAGVLRRAATASASLVGCASGCGVASNRAAVASTVATRAGIGLALTARPRTGHGPLHVGDEVVFRAVVTNTGTVRLTRVHVRGGPAEPICRVAALAPGAATACTAVHVVRRADVVGGVVTETAMASGRAAALGSVDSRLRTAGVAALAAPAPQRLADTGSDLRAPLAGAGGLLALALGLAVVARRRVVRLRRR